LDATRAYSIPRNVVNILASVIIFEKIGLGFGSPDTKLSDVVCNVWSQIVIQDVTTPILQSKLML
jgi:hypothetical protein